MRVRSLTEGSVCVLYLVEEVPDVVQVLVEVDVPQSAWRLAGVLQPLLHALVQVLLLQPLQDT